MGFIIKYFPVFLQRVFEYRTLFDEKKYERVVGRIYTRTSS